MTWEDGGNWSGGAIPDSFDESALINATSHDIVTAGTINIGSLSTSNGFTGKITLGGTLTLSNTMGESGDFTHLAGTYIDAGFPTIIEGSITLGATFTSTGSVILTGSAADETITSGGEIFNDLIVSDGLVGYWKLDSTASSGVLDHSGYGNHGVVNGNPTTSTGSDEKPPVNFNNVGAIEFDGSGDFVEIESSVGDVFDFGSTQQFTIAAWINLPADIGDAFVVGKGNYLVSPTFALYYDSTVEKAIEIAFHDGAGSGCWIETITDVAGMGWVHVAGVVETRTSSCLASSVPVYINGVNESTTVNDTGADTNLNVSSNADLRIGAGVQSGSTNFEWDGKQ